MTKAGQREHESAGKTAACWAGLRVVYSEQTMAARSVGDLAADLADVSVGQKVQSSAAHSAD